MNITLEKWQLAIKHLSNKDNIIAQIINSYKGEYIEKSPDAFLTLARAIVGQQISTKAADTVWKRLSEKLESITAPLCLEANEECLRSAGLSRQKIVYLKELAANVLQQPDFWQNVQFSEEQLIRKELLKLKGIGHWTADMFLIFHVLHPDILPLSDIGLIRAIERHYNSGNKLSKDQIILISDKWIPYRTVATWYLWRSTDPITVQY